MLVRWQYWFASAKMFTDHPLTGIGPGNFAYFYPQYKLPAAPETISDPHSFPLSLLTQYGPLGLLGFLAIFFIPLRKLMTQQSTDYTPAAPSFLSSAVTYLAIVAVAILLIRPILMPLSPSDSSEEISAAAIISYVIPAIAFIAASFLLAIPLYAAQHPRRDPQAATIVVLFCAVAGVLIHNLIDFAIFEPGILTALMAILACIIALHLNKTRPAPITLTPPPYLEMAATIAAAAVLFAYLNYAVIPPLQSTAKIRQASAAFSNSQFQQAADLLTSAAKDDSLDPDPLSIKGSQYLQRFYTSPAQNNLLLEADNAFRKAILRNPADFKNFERLAEVYALLAQNSPAGEKTLWLNQAFKTADSAVQRYPGSDRLHLQLAKIAEQLNKIDIALKNYQQAIDIEDSFRRQFHTMYPDREIFSRLGQDNYQFAKNKITTLLQNASPNPNRPPN